MAGGHHACALWAVAGMQWARPGAMGFAGASPRPSGTLRYFLEGGSVRCAFRRRGGFDVWSVSVAASWVQPVAAVHTARYSGPPFVPPRVTVRRFASSSDRTRGGIWARRAHRAHRVGTAFARVAGKRGLGAIREGATKCGGGLGPGGRACEECQWTYVVQISLPRRRVDECATSSSSCSGLSAGCQYWEYAMISRDAWAALVPWFMHGWALPDAARGRWGERVL
ncbi:hypothetical protein L226DRAFT_145110 [Lentinus tigrinus ALCF2SS1-7]|uniref:uncharacterized protein n=1 Tax=Lentinus tigrinus ALCF2SS1-7 TaxID=1328758 RepID=UPI001166310F|nr:hypothetical protein L226DRAFT_145110 [Lentinus tigrinus ALCF2SS1-7]